MAPGTGARSKQIQLASASTESRVPGRPVMHREVRSVEGTVTLVPGVKAAFENATDEQGSFHGVGGVARFEHRFNLMHQAGRVSDIGNWRKEKLARDRLLDAL